MRACPKCKVPLILRKIEADAFRLEIDVCGQCEGVWADGGEVAKLKVLHGLMPNMYGNVSVKRDLAAGDCPACATHPALQRVPVGAFAVDRCLSCLGVWFDGGELGPMLTKQGYAALLHALARALPG